MKRILYLLPFIILVSCKQTRFVCNQQLMSPKESLAVAAPKAIPIDTINIIQNSFQNKGVAKQNHITNSEKNAPRQVLKKSYILHQKIKQNSYIQVNPRDTSIKDPGLQRAKDAMDDEGNWITAYFVFWGLAILFFLTLFGVISFGIILSEEILSILITICAIGILVSFIGSIFKNRNNKSIVSGYPSEESRHKTHYRLLYLMIFITCCL